MVKNGYRNGRIRYRCKACGQDPYRDSRARPDITNLAIFTRFLSYLTGKATQGEISGNTGRTLRRRWQWCWHIPTPPITSTGEIYPQLFIDGIYLSYKWCLLIAHNGDHVVARQWSTRENSASYQALLSHLAPPELVVTDGHGGALKALSQLWPHVPVQRCLVHVHRNNIRDLTTRPQTSAGRALHGLSQRLLTITTIAEATEWISLLFAFHGQYETTLKQRTYAKDVHASQRRTGRTWWYTHDRDRRVYLRLAKLVRRGTLFAYLETEPARARTTNTVESFNAKIRALIRHHRGLTQDHMIAAIDWLIHAHTEFPAPPSQILTDWQDNDRPPRTTIPHKAPPTPVKDGPVQYDTGLSEEEGLWARRGWAGRSH